MIKVRICLLTFISYVWTTQVTGCAQSRNCFTLAQSATVRASGVWYIAVQRFNRG